MIRLTFMTDAALVIGASTREGNAARLARLPGALKAVMAQLSQAPNVVLGAPSLASAPSPGLASAQTFIVTRNADFQAPDAVPNAQVCGDVLELVDRFGGSDEELNVLGGLGVFRMFLPFADRLDVAQLAAPVPGDLVFDEWTTSGFELSSESAWEGGRTLRFVRRPGPLERNKRAAMAFYDLAFNQCRPRDAVKRYVGAQYRQHNPHVGDGPEAFIAYFKRMAAEYPGKRVFFKRAVAEGDLVALHCRQVWPGDSDYAGIDLFRFDAAGKIVEHWDVLQPVPEKSANDNGLF